MLMKNNEQIKMNYKEIRIKSDKSVSSGWFLGEILLTLLYYCQPTCDNFFMM